VLEVSIKKNLPGFSLDVSFSTNNGETLALLGASGCGKSLTLQCIAGVLRPDSGYIKLGERVLFDSGKHINLPPQARRVGFVFQHSALFPNMTVLQNVVAGIKSTSDNSRVKSDKIAEARRWLAAARVSNLEESRPAELSGGERQRVALARALASRPEAILFDEPFSALDDYLRWQLELELAETLRNFEGARVLVSHSRDEVYRLSDRVCVLDNGHSERAVDTRELFRAPETLSACLISGCKNFSRAEALPDGRVRALDWGCDLSVASPPIAGMKYIGVRAHYVLPAAPSDTENVITCDVSRVIDDVFGTVLMLQTPSEEDAEYSHLRMEISKTDWAALNSPATLRVRLAPQDIITLR
jgi:molybdate transport system ATP-binding protein